MTNYKSAIHRSHAAKDERKDANMLACQNPGPRHLMGLIQFDGHPDIPVCVPPGYRVVLTFEKNTALDPAEAPKDHKP